MKLEMNIEKKHLWVMIGIAMVISAAAFVFATGYTPNLASHATLFVDTIMGKGSGTVNIDDAMSVTQGLTVAGAVTAGSAAINGNLAVTGGVVSGDGSGLVNVPFSSSCIGRRVGKSDGTALDKDGIAWCTSDYPTLSFCSIVDNSAGTSSTTPFSAIPSGCNNDGVCDATSTRTNLGSDGPYLEIVEKTPKVQGCWQYDKGHARTDYRIQIICCK